MRHTPLLLAIAICLVTPSLQAPMMSDKQDDDTSLQDLLVHYMIQQQQQQQPEQYGQQGGDMGRGGMGEPTQYNDEMMKGLLKQYLQGMQGGMPGGMQGGMDSPDMGIHVTRMMLNHYLQSQKAQKQQYYQKKGQADLLSTLVGHYTEKGNEGTDALKNILALFTKSQAPEPSDKRQMMLSLLKHAMNSPENSLAKKLLNHAITQQDGEDQGVLAVLFTHMLSKNKGEEKELVKSLLHTVMTSDYFKQGHSQQLMLMLLQHYMEQDGGDDKEAVGLNLLYWLSENKDPHSAALLRKLVYHMLTTGGQRKVPKDTPEEYRWKWMTPEPCRMVDNSNVVVYQKSCPNNLQCSVGPVRVTVNGTQRRVSLCAMPTEYLSFHACSISDGNNTVLKSQACPSTSGQCNMGPFTVQVMGTEGTATFCSGVVDNFGRRKSIIDRACRVEDKYRFYPIQRRCPYGFSCSNGPFPANMTNGEKVHAYVCDVDKEKEEKQSNFMSKMLHLMLGVNDDMGDMDKAMGKGNMSQGMGGDDFLKLMLKHLMEQGKAKEMEKKDMGMNKRDHVGLMILKHFVMKMDEGEGQDLLKKVIMHMWQKAENYGLDEGDRKVLNTLILQFVQAKKKAAAKEEQEQKEEMMKKAMMKKLMEHAKESQSSDMLKVLLGHMKMKMEGKYDKDDMKMKGYNDKDESGEKGMWKGKKDDDDEDKMGEKGMLQMLVKHVLAQESRQSESKGYKEMVMMLLKHMMMEKEKKDDSEEKQGMFLMSLLKHVMEQKREMSSDDQHKEALMKMLGHMMMERRESNDKDPMAALYKKMMSQREDDSEGEWKGKMMLQMLHHAIQEKLEMHADQHKEIKEKLSWMKDKIMGRDEDKEGDGIYKLLKLMREMKD